MFVIENRAYERVPVEPNAGILGAANSNDDGGGKIMNKIAIKDISLGGIGFVASANRRYEKQKVYDLRLRADVPWDEPELDVKITVIRESPEDAFGRKTYGAVYRNLSDKQLTMLRQIVSHQSGLNSAMQRM